ncbi:MAG: ABC transporter permease [Planctomycetes bacterium]|nr:ABC transporter permease [Planctomycetota bacterium]
MTTYAIKRLLLMVPTTFVISLVLFVVMNLAPGRPDAGLPGSDQGAAQGTEAGRRESYRLFRHQFALDKPILFNARFTTTPADVRSLLETIANADGSRPPGAILRATEAIEDLGAHAVAPLVALLDDDEARIRALAVRALALAAQRPLLAAWEARRLGPEAEERNRAIARENRVLRTWVYADGDSEDIQREIVATWKGWCAANRARFTLDGWRKAATFFFDTRFARYWRNLFRLDLGSSYLDKRPVLLKIVERLPYSMTLSLLSIVIAYAASVPLGVFSAVKRGSLADRIISVVLFMLYSLPSFFVGTLLLRYLSQGSDALRLFPTGGFASLDAARMTTPERILDILWHITLPLVCLSYGALAALSRYARAGLLEVLRSDYVRTARAKGLPERVVILKHALRNGVIPLLTLLAGLLPAVFGGAVIVESIFAIPGMGLLMLESIRQYDYATAMGIGLISAILVQVGILLSDLSYALVDPRVSFVAGRRA